MTMWYPENKKELESFIEGSFKQKIDLDKKPKNIHGLIVPHAGYEYSGKIAGKAFALLGNKKINKAIIIGPSHYIPTNKALTTNKKELLTPLGPIKTFNLDFETSDIDEEHSINNQIPFLQKSGIKEVLPLMIGSITNEQAKEIAENISKINAVYIFSTDLSHFLKYEDAVKKDKKTIDIIKDQDKEDFGKIDACGIFPLMILFYLCDILKIRPRLIEYKNSGDMTGDKSSVVGYASFFF